MSQNLLWTHETALAPVTTSASEARAFVQAHLVEHGLSYLVEDVRLVVSELVTNAVLHARTPLTLRIEGLHFCVMVSVQDQSPSVPVVTDEDRDATSGRGLDIIEQFSDFWGLDAGTDGGKSVWASFARRPVLMTSRSSIA